MPRLILPPAPPPAPLLLTLLHDSYRRITHRTPTTSRLDLLLHRALHDPTLGPLLTIPPLTDVRIIDWIARHHDTLVDTVTTTALAGHNQQVVDLVTLLLLLAHHRPGPPWITRLTDLGLAATHRPDRLHDRAVLCELGARRHTAHGHLATAGALLDLQHRTLAANPDGPAVTWTRALLWRRIRLAWLRGHVEHAHSLLHVLDALLRDHPDPHHRLLTRIAHAEILTHTGDLATAEHLLAAAAATATGVPRSIVERVDALLGIGHIRHHTLGTDAARAQWHHILTLVDNALDPTHDRPLDPPLRDALTQRRRHTHALLALPPGHPPRPHPEFTVLHPTAPRHHHT
ncbi:hypothetical protein AB0I60_04915 [Actinosynnema sp. NPDC050436]|uniref:hypothetical protein n=1 Tax=Actinosynnema sp. NPDC050436 TaxID=3155659 RepID=UPI003409DF7D